MQEVSAADLERLRSGAPPMDPGLLEAMTAGEEVWLNPFVQHYLNQHIPSGGSKVKVIVGPRGSGKTHMLRRIQHEAIKLGYTAVFLSAREETWRLGDVVSLYRAIASQIDREELLRGVSLLVARRLGYGPEDYDGSGSILPLMVEQERHPIEIARREIRKAAGQAFAGGDMTASFHTFLYTIIAHHMMDHQQAVLDACWKWILGEKLDPAERNLTKLFDRLTKPSARVWFYSLIRLLRLSRKTGLVILMDDFEALTERDPETGRFRYTPNAAKDAFELIRQLIDDVELLEHFLLVIGVRPEAVLDEKRGIRSYEALWMRLQSGLIQTSCFNPLADMVDLESHNRAAGGDAFPEAAVSRLRTAMEAHGYVFRFARVEPSDHDSPLVKAVKQTAGMMQKVRS